MAEWTLVAIEKPPLTEHSADGLQSKPVWVYSRVTGPDIAILLQDQFSNDWVWRDVHNKGKLLPLNAFDLWRRIDLPITKMTQRGINAIWYWTDGRVGFGHRNGKARDYRPSAASLGRVARLILWLRVHRRWLLDVRERNGQLAVYPSEDLEHWRLQRQVQKEYWG
jgi:hypothetical protein